MEQIPQRAWKVRYLKVHYVRKAMKKKQSGNCGCGCQQWMIETSIGGRADCHHKLHDTAKNRAHFPLFIHSLFNLQVVRHDCHMGMGNGKGRLQHYTPYFAEQYERFLERHPMISAWVNGESKRLWAREAA